jgi:hypothetical protein
VHYPPSPLYLSQRKIETLTLSDAKRSCSFGMGNRDCERAPYCNGDSPTRLGFHIDMRLEEGGGGDAAAVWRVRGISLTPIG